MKIWNKLCDLAGVEFVSQPLTYARNSNETTLPVPGYRQTKDYTCGYVAGLMVVHTFYPKSSAEKLYYAVQADEENGTSTSKLVRALRAFSVGVSIKKHVCFSDIQKAINNGFPVITCVSVDEELAHWVVLYGYSKHPSKVFVAGDAFPYFVKTVIRWQDFRHRWFTDRECLICHGK